MGPPLKAQFRCRFLQGQADGCRRQLAVLKSGSFTENLPVFLATLNDTGRPWYRAPDWYRDYKTWMRHFGSCRIVFFEEAKADLLESFLNAAQLPSLPELPEMPPQQERLTGFRLPISWMCYGIFPVTCITLTGGSLEPRSRTT